jgi:hypothetical protein
VLRQACCIAEETGFELAETSNRLTAELDSLSEFEDFCQDLIESSELVRVALMTLKPAYQI